MKEETMGMKKKEDKSSDDTSKVSKIEVIETCANCQNYRSPRSYGDGVCMVNHDSKGNFVTVIPDKNTCRMFKAMPEPVKEDEDEANSPTIASK